MTDFSLKQLKFTKAIYGRLVATIAIFLGGYLVRNLGKSEALANIKEMRPSLRFATFTFAAAICLLLLLNLPIENSNEKLMPYYEVIYYCLLRYGAFMGGLMISIVLMLYKAADQVIIFYHLDKDADFLIASKDVEEQAEM